MKYILSSNDGSTIMISDDNNFLKKVSLEINKILSSRMMSNKVSGRLLAASNKLVVSSTPTHLREDHNSSLLNDEHKNILTKLHTRFAKQVIIELMLAFTLLDVDY